MEDKRTPVSHCGKRDKHRPHKYWGPNQDPNLTTQIKYQCPGSK